MRRVATAILCFGVSVLAWGALAYGPPATWTASTRMAALGVGALYVGLYALAEGALALLTSVLD
jgi:hypothetical protein